MNSASRVGLWVLVGLGVFIFYAGAAHLITWLPPHSSADSEPLGFMALALLAGREATRLLRKDP